MIREAIAALVDGRSLTEAEAAALLRPEAQASAWAGEWQDTRAVAGLMVVNRITRHKAGLKPCSYDPAWP
jgi:hypothetical protein